MKRGSQVRFTVGSSRNSDLKTGSVLERGNRGTHGGPATRLRGVRGPGFPLNLRRHLHWRKKFSY